jgi:hypothetical protein
MGSTSNQRASCSAKETINKMRRQSPEEEKIFENHIYEKVLISLTL